eukprot:scaffold28410_cov112-Isochrysis_galbana.AAC.4
MATRPRAPEATLDGSQRRRPVGATATAARTPRLGGTPGSAACPCGAARGVRTSACGRASRLARACSAKQKLGCASPKWPEGGR